MTATTETAVPDIVRKVEKLLRKAENTDHPAERDAFMAKAQSLIAEHEISEAELALARPAAERWVMTDERIDITGTYTGRRMMLLFQILKNNGLDAVLTADSAKFKQLHVFGTADDIAMSKTLWLSLMLQCELEVQGRGGSRAYRSNFWMAFTNEVNRRMRQAKAAARNEARAESAEISASVELALVDKADAAVDARKEQYGRLGKARRRGAAAGHGEGYHEGREAGSRADLGGKSVTA